MFYLLMVGLVGIPLTILDRCVIALSTALWFRRTRSTVPADGFYHATGNVLDTIDLHRGTGQLGNGLYLHPGFVAPSDRFVLKITGAPLTTTTEVAAYHIRYVIATGHYCIAMILSVFYPKAESLTNQWVSPILWMPDRIFAPEFGYPWDRRQWRLSDSPRNRRWLEQCELQWITIANDGTVTEDPHCPPILAWIRSSIP